MRLGQQVKPITYLKAHAAEILSELQETGEPLIVTQNGEAKAVVQDIASYEDMRQTLALLRLLALRSGEFEAGEAQDLEEAFAEIESTQRNEALKS